MAPGDKIAKARNWHRPFLTQDDLAEKAGITRASLARYEAGANVPETKLETIASVLGLPVEWFQTDDDSEPPYDRVQLVDNFQRMGPTGGFDIRTVTSSVGLPMWVGTMAGHKEECHFEEEPVPRLQEVPLLLIADHDPAQCRVFRVAGSSMSPRVEHSQLGIVVLNPDAPINTLVMARRPDNVLFVKALRPGKAPQPYSLHSVNAGLFPPIEDVEDWQIVGSVIAFLAPPTAGDRNIEWNFGQPLRA